MDEITYNWNFNPLEVIYNEDTLSDVVNVVHWQLVATHTESGTTIQNIGTVSLETPSIESFIPFNQLTKEIVTNWVETKLGTDAVDTMKANLSSSINDKLHPIKGTMSPPWS